MTMSGQSLVSPDGDGDYLDQYLTRVPAKITGVQAGAGRFAGFNVYSWTEQQFYCNATPMLYKDSDAPKSGTFARGMALEKNNQLLTPPFFADLRIIGAYNGEPIWEFSGNVGKPTLPAGHGARVIGGTQAVPTPGGVITYTSADYDTDGYWNLTVNPTRLTIQLGMGGYYVVGCNIAWFGPSTGARQVGIYRNGFGPGANLVALDNRQATTDPILPFTNQAISTAIKLTTGDYLEIWVGFSGSSYVVGENDDSPVFWMQQVGSL